MASIMLKGREIPLIYTVYEMKQIQEEIAPMAIAINKVLGRNPDDKEDSSLFGTAEHLSAAATMIRILGNAGLEEAGETPDLTEKKIMRWMRPAELTAAIGAAMDAMNEGLASEIPPAERKKGPVDVTLEEMEKKKEKES